MDPMYSCGCTPTFIASSHPCCGVDIHSTKGRYYKHTQATPLAPCNLHVTCGTTKKLIGKCASIGCEQGNVNAEFSEDTIKHNKEETVLSGIKQLNNTIKLIINSGKELFIPPTEEEYKEYFRKLSGSALSLSEQVLLFHQISSEFIENNALNIFINVQNMLSRNNVSVHNKEIKEAINETMKNVLPNIIIKYNYGQDFLEMNYANAYQTMYYATSLNLYRFKMTIIYQVFRSYINQLPKEK